MSRFENRLTFESVDEDEFKATMRCIASSVSVITSRAGAVLNGMTATAVCSVSASPPTLLVVINRSSNSHALIDRTGVYAVNVLTADQAILAEHFAKKSSDPFRFIEHSMGTTGVPLIEGCCAQFECLVEAKHVANTHSIFVGRVVAARHSDKLPLLHRGGGFIEVGAVRFVMA